jgi:hypothetical protein
MKIRLTCGCGCPLLDPMDAFNHFEHDGFWSAVWTLMLVKIEVQFT